MPQLVKDGKHVFAWTIVGKDGEITIPPEAVAEYGFDDGARLMILPASRTSGGFAVGLRESVLESPVASAINKHAQLKQCRVPEGELVQIGNNHYCWVTLRGGRIVLQPGTLRAYGVTPGSRLLVARGSGLAVSHLVKGPIVEEAKKHPELEVFGAQE